LEKYFFISLTLTKLVSISHFHKKEEDDEIIPGLEIEETPDSSMKQMDKKVPMQSSYSTCMISPSGMFIANAIEDTIKKDLGADEATIIFVKEISKQEYETTVMYNKTKNLPVPVAKDVMDEIDDLVSRTESGELRVYKPLTPEVPKSKDEADLRDAGLPLDLFNTDGLWED
jgi:hypothetical protein